jgi:hypothetical protein
MADQLPGAGAWLSTSEEYCAKSLSNSSNSRFRDCKRWWASVVMLWFGFENKYNVFKPQTKKASENQRLSPRAIQRTRTADLLITNELLYQLS